MGAPPSIGSLDSSLAPKEMRTLVETAGKQFGQVQTLLSKNLNFAQNMDAQITDPLAVRGAARWQAPVYENSWVDFGSGRIVHYRKDADGRVHIEGAMKSGTVNTTAFTLPAGYLPDQALRFAVGSNSAFGQVVVDTSGTVTLAVGSNTSANFGFSFLAADASPGQTLAQDVRFKCTLGARPSWVQAVSACLASDKNSFVAVGPVAWTYQQDGQVRVTSIPGLSPDTDYLVSFWAQGD